MVYYEREQTTWIFAQVLPFLCQLCDLEYVAYSYCILVFSFVSLDKNAVNKYMEKCFLIY